MKNIPVFATVIRSKLFEAMGMGLPILLASPSGEASGIVRQTGSGVYASGRTNIIGRGRPETGRTSGGNGKLTVCQLRRGASLFTDQAGGENAGSPTGGGEQGSQLNCSCTTEVCQVLSQAPLLPFIAHRAPSAIFSGDLTTAYMPWETTPVSSSAPPKILCDKLPPRWHVIILYIQGAGICSPPLKAEFTAEDAATMVAAINAARPDVLWVGMTAPKQEKWLYPNRDWLNVKFIAAIGAVFDFYTGKVKRSPLIFEKLGFEWLFRLLQGPHRWRR